ncbi:hypothetical protein AB1K83_00635 [Sporosarcina sp. 179-K 3D1 HS]|uniref:hypothetical protein n=1 Tax=Sporosarcina sp. 179-K 3D1 HS TaxID=3232169 RepID=UPI0039A2F07F
MDEVEDYDKCGEDSAKMMKNYDKPTEEYDHWENSDKGAEDYDEIAENYVEAIKESA